VKIDGRPIMMGSPHEMIKNGTAFVTEDRKILGLNLIGAVRTNISIAYLYKVLKLKLLLNFKREAEEIDALINQ
jgi:ABC-type sugar transport system ATPase subunit